MDEAARIRREAEEYADAARRRADAFAEARIRRLRELSDRLIATAETVDRRFGEAVAIREQLDELVAALGEAARRAAQDLAGEPEQAPPVSIAPPPAPRIGQVQVQDVRGASSGPPLS
ncbi:MAG TPA: hypothetical protein VF549_14580 [Solirubrobacteraceae bacterium]